MKVDNEELIDSSWDPLYTTVLGLTRTYVLMDPR